MEVYHSDDSQEGEVQVEKVLDGVENTDVLTVNGLEKFSDYTVLAKKNLLGADNSEGSVKLYFNNQEEPESGEGVYSDLSTTVRFPFTIEGNFPADATDKQIDITLAKGLTWNSYKAPTGFASSATAAYYINQIRRRAGLPNMATGLSVADFKAKYENERFIELAFEGHRFFDVRRWMEGEKYFKNIRGMRIIKNADGTFTETPITVQNRLWESKMNLFPIPQSEIMKSGGVLTQNEGW